jgi:uncharacterized protein (TIGR00251 family)
VSKPLPRERPVTHLDLKITPKSSRDAVLGWLGEALKVSVTAVPEKGRANAAVEALLAKVLDVPVSAVEVVAGHGAPRKRVAIQGLHEDQLRQRLTAHLLNKG